MVKVYLMSFLETLASSGLAAACTRSRQGPLGAGGLKRMIMLCNSSPRRISSWSLMFASFQLVLTSGWLQYGSSLASLASGVMALSGLCMATLGGCGAACFDSAARGPPGLGPVDSAAGAAGVGAGAGTVAILSRPSVGCGSGARGDATS